MTIRAPNTSDWDSEDGTISRYGMDVSGFEPSRGSGGGRRFYTPVQTLARATQPRVQSVPGLFPVGKAVGGTVD